MPSLPLLLCLPVVNTQHPGFAELSLQPLCPHMISLGPNFFLPKRSRVKLSVGISLPAMPHPNTVLSAMILFLKMATLLGSTWTWLWGEILFNATRKPNIKISFDFFLGRSLWERKGFKSSF